MIFGMDFHQTKMKLLLNRKGAQVRYLPDLMIVQAVQTIPKPVEVITVESSGVSRYNFSSGEPWLTYSDLTLLPHASNYSSVFEGFLIKYLAPKKSFIRLKSQMLNENGKELFNSKKIFLLIL